MTPPPDRPGRRRARFGLWFVAVCGLVAAQGCARREPEPVSDPPAPAAAPPAFVPATPALGVGAPLPAVAAAGWINGPPPAAGAPGVRLTLVDVWADWCPFCRAGAPDLVRLYDKFSGRGIAFVSVTNLDRRSAAAFVEQFGVRWPSGYGATAEQVTALGAGSGMPMPGYGVAPTVYLVGPDGRVRWTDRQARYRHETSEEWARALETAIEAVLAGP